MKTIMQILKKTAIVLSVVAAITAKSEEAVIKGEFGCAVCKSSLCFNGAPDCGGYIKEEANKYYYIKNGDKLVAPSGSGYPHDIFGAAHCEILKKVIATATLESIGKTNTINGIMVIEVKAKSVEIDGKTYLPRS